MIKSNSECVFWETYRSDDQRARATYDPDWSTQLPWCTFISGAAGRQFATASSAIKYLEELGFKFTQAKIGARGFHTPHEVEA